MERSLKAKAMDNMTKIRRNYLDWCSTFGPCSNACGNRGRGSGLCGNCYEELLADQCGRHLAAEYHHKVKSLTFTTGKVMDYIDAPEGVEEDDCALESLCVRLESLCVRLKSGEYNGDDIMKAVIAIKGLIEMEAMLNAATTPQLVGKKD